MNLIKEMNNSIKVKDPVELAFESVANPDSDMARIAEYWREMIEGRPDEFGVSERSGRPDQMGEEQLRAGIGDDLEQLEYSPEEVDRMVDQVIQMVVGR